MGNDKNAIADLKKLRDEIRVKMHLGEMEVKEWWADVEPKLEGLEESIARGSERAVESVDVFVDEFVQAFRRVRDRLNEGE